MSAARGGEVGTEAELTGMHAALLRYGKALRVVRAREGKIADAEGYDEWCDALEALETLCLALAEEDAQRK